MPRKARLHISDIGANHTIAEVFESNPQALVGTRWTFCDMDVRADFFLLEVIGVRKKWVTLEALYHSDPRRRFAVRPRDLYRVPSAFKYVWQRGLPNQFARPLMAMEGPFRGIVAIDFVTVHGVTLRPLEPSQEEEGQFLTWPVFFSTYNTDIDVIEAREIDLQVQNERAQFQRARDLTTSPVSEEPQASPAWERLDDHVGD